MTTTKTITNAQIFDLRCDARVAGDEAMVAICTRALNGSKRAIAECVRVIRAAEAMA